MYQCSFNKVFASSVFSTKNLHSYSKATLFLSDLVFSFTILLEEKCRKNKKDVKSFRSSVSPSTIGKKQTKKRNKNHIFSWLPLVPLGDLQFC